MKDRTKTILGFLFMAMSILVIVLSAITFEDQPMKERKVKCYDRNYNEIIGQTCLEKYDGNTGQIVSTTALFVLLLAVGICFLASRSWVFEGRDFG